MKILFYLLSSLFLVGCFPIQGFDSLLSKGGNPGALGLNSFSTNVRQEGSVNLRLVEVTQSQAILGVQTNMVNRYFSVVVNNQLTLNTSEDVIRLNNLSSNTNYNVQVIAVNSNGERLASSNVASFTTMPENNNSNTLGYTVPERKVLGSPNIILQQTGSDSYSVENLRTSESFQLNNSDNPLAFALKMARPGDVLGLAGNFPGVHIGKFGHGSRYVYWPNSAIIENIGIKSLNPNEPARIGTVHIQGNILEASSHGVNDLTFENVTLKSSSEHDKTPLLIYNGSVQGIIRLYNVSLKNNGHGNFGGTGMMWGVRAHGNSLFYDFRGINCDAAQEHCLYLDAPGLLTTSAYDPSLAGAFIERVVQNGPSGRTGIQIVNRANEDSLNPGGGQLVIRDSELLTRAGSGGSAVTVAGFLGNVYLENLDIDTDLGGIVVYSSPNHGLILNENGFTTNQVKMKNINIIAPNAQRSHIALSGVENIEIHEPFNIVGSNWAFNFNTEYGGGIDNGQISFKNFQNALYDYNGFNNTNKVQDSGVPLSEQEINSLQN